MAFEFGSGSTGEIRGAVDSILLEFVRFETEKQKWNEERKELLLKISNYEKELQEKNDHIEKIEMRLSMNANNNTSYDSMDNNDPTNNNNMDNLSKRKHTNELEQIFNESENIDNNKNGKNDNEYALKKQDPKEKVKIYDTSNAFELQLHDKLTLRHHLDSVRCLCLNDDENILISGSDDGTIKLWDLSRISANIDNWTANNASKNKTNIIPITYRSHSSSVNCCSIMPNSDVLITAGFDGNMFGWKLPTNGVGPILFDIPSLPSFRTFAMDEHTDIIWDISCHHSLPLVASCSADSTIKIYNTFTHEIQCDLHLNSNKYIAPTSIMWNYSFNQSSNKLCFGTVSGHLALLDVEKQALFGDMRDDGKGNDNSTDGGGGSGYQINRIFGDEMLNSQLIYCACDDHKIRVFDVRSESCIHSLDAHSDSVNSLVVQCSLKCLVSASDDSTLKVWNFYKNVENEMDMQFEMIQEMNSSNTHPCKWDQGIQSMIYSNSLQWVFTGGSDGIKIYQTNV